MKKLFPTCLAAGLLAGAAHGAISVGVTYDFPARPSVAEGWSTLTIGAEAATIGTATDLDNAVNTLDASTIITELGSSGTVPPSANSIARYNTANGYLQTRPTQNDYLVLMATAVNDTGADIAGASIAYDWGQANTSTPTEQIPGHRVYFSQTGQPGSWTVIPELSNFANNSANQRVTGALPVGNWPAGGTLYILWADDNADGGTEGAYTIDNFVVTSGGIPLSVALSSPANNTVLTAPADVTITAAPAGTMAATGVSFFRNGVLVGTDNTAPFSVTVTGLAAGSHAFHAVAQNASETAVSVTNTVVVRQPYVSYTGDMLFESFDGLMGTGTVAPTGWYVGTTPPINGGALTVGDGSTGPMSAVLGWNYGTSVDDEDRSLGTAPTGGDRNVEVRIVNNSGAAINAFNFSFDGEVWRTHATIDTVETLVTHYSVDGTNWFETGINFTSPVPGQNPALQLNGHDFSNKTPGVGGTVALAVPVAPGGVLRIRWQNVNDDGTDGALAINNFIFDRATVQIVNITAPEEGTTFVQGAPITVAATAVMNNPVTNVAFFRDGVLIGNDSTAPYSVVYSNATLGGHTLTATARDNTGATMSTATGVNITVIENVPPSISITNPVVGYTTNVGTMISIGAEASDTDGGIARVDFFVNGTLWGSDSSSPYVFEYVDALAGNVTISAVAVDIGNFQATSTIQFTVTNPPNVTLILTNGSTWKYLDNGSDQGTAWRNPGFNDSGWSNGIAEFGYGDGPTRPERTVVGFGGVSTNKYVTTYFRKTFNVANPSAFSDLQANLLRDDGAVVYINGTEVWRSHMTNGAFNYRTLAGPAGAGGAASDDGNSYQSTNISPSVLVAGQNVIAVEIHQEGLDSSDISFDFMLWGVSGGSTRPRLNVVQSSANQVTISWGADAAGFTLQSNTDLGNAAGWANVQGPLAGAGSTTVTTSGTLRFYRLRQ